MKKPKKSKPPEKRSVPKRGVTEAMVSACTKTFKPACDQCRSSDISLMRSGDVLLVRCFACKSTDPKRPRQCHYGEVDLARYDSDREFAKDWVKRYSSSVRSKNLESVFDGMAKIANGLQPWLGSGRLTDLDIRTTLSMQLALAQAAMELL